MGFKIFVGNLSYEASEEQIKALFEAYGPVDSVRIIKDRETGRPRGFAFVEMSREGDRENAIKAMDGYRHNNRNLRVSKAEDHPPGPRPGGPRGDGPPRWQGARPPGASGPRPVTTGGGGQATADGAPRASEDGRPEGGGGGGGGPVGEGERFGPDKPKHKWTQKKGGAASAKRPKEDETEDDGGGNTRRWDRLMDDE